MKVYDGLTEYVASDEEAERVQRTLYRTDASARAVVLPAYRARLEVGDIARFREQGYLAMEGVLAPDEVAAHARQHRDLLVRFQARLARVTGRPVDEIADDMRQGRYLDAGEALAYGLIDTIGGPPP